MTARELSGLSLPTRETLGWLRGQLPVAARLLEVGCGAGELAAALLETGHAVVALDPHRDALAQARARGVDARAARFPDFRPATGEAPFDAIVLARVLHHVDDLAGVCRRAAELVAPGGIVLVEDFAWETVDRATAVWLYGLLRMADALGVVPAAEWDLASDPLEAWRTRNTREHALHPRGAMLAELARPLELVSVEGAPYAYRWISRLFADDPRGEALAGAVLTQERDLIAADVLVPIGLRIVARKPAGSRP